MHTSTIRRCASAAKIAFLGVMAVSVACSTEYHSQNGQANTEALTESHSAEVRTVITNFYLRWFSLDAIKDPAVQSEVATGEHLNFWGYARMGKELYNEPFWLITKSTTVDDLHVLEYNSEQFEAVARVSRLEDKVNPNGKIVDPTTITHKSCGVFVFVREDRIWKLATYFDMSVPQDIDRDWRDAPAWSKQLIGDLPRDMCD